MTAPPADQRPQVALLLRLGAALVLSIMLVCVKLVTESGVSLTETLFWRQLPTVPLILAWFAWSGRLGELRSKRLPAHAGRAMTGLAGMFLNFGAVTLLRACWSLAVFSSSSIRASSVSAWLRPSVAWRRKPSAPALAFASASAIAAADWARPATRVG